MGGRSPYLEEALLLAERHSQVWLETSQAPLSAIKEALTLTADRVLFGSGGLARDFATEWDKIRQLEPDIAPDEYQNVIHNNALRLFFSSPAVTEPRPGTLRVFRQPS
jgi:predicted TIM-barrel fold metal-dependent hydrolase